MKKTRVTAISLVALAALLLSGCTTELRAPLVDEMTPASTEAQAKVDLERWADDLTEQFPGQAIPEVDRVRFITLEEWATVIAECLTEDGFSATADDGSLSGGPGHGEDLPYALAFYTCNAKFPINPQVNVPLNEDQIRYLYDYYTQVATPCLEELGFEISDPPSQQSYISAYDQGTWHPHNEVAEQRGDVSWEQANAACPQVPSDLYGK